MALLKNEMNHFGYSWGNQKLKWECIIAQCCDHSCVSQFCYVYCNNYMLQLCLVRKDIDLTSERVLLISLQNSGLYCSSDNKFSIDSLIMARTVG